MPPESEVKDDATVVVTDDKETPVGDEKETPSPGESKKDESTGKDIGDAKLEKEVSDSEDRIQNLLDKHGFDSYEELEEKFDGLKDLEDLIGKRDAKQLLEDSDYLAKVKEFWKEQDEQKKQEGETLEETIDRLKKEREDLEKELKDRDTDKAKEKERKEAKRNTERLISSFNTTVTGEIDKIKDLPKEYMPFLKEYLGVDNPANEIDIGLKPEIRSMAKEGIKKFQDLEQIIIRRFLDGKIETPKITDVDGSKTPVDTENKPKNLKEARAALRETFGIK